MRSPPLAAQISQSSAVELTLVPLHETAPNLSKRFAEQIPTEPDTDSGAEESDTETESEGDDDEEDTVSNTHYKYVYTTCQPGAFVCFLTLWVKKSHQSAGTYPAMQIPLLSSVHPFLRHDFVDVVYTEICVCFHSDKIWKCKVHKGSGDVSFWVHAI